MFRQSDAQNGANYYAFVHGDVRVEVMMLPRITLMSQLFGG